MSEDFQIKNEKVEAILKGLGAQLKKDMPEGMGFSLLMFDYGDNGAMFYISSAERETMLTAMKEFMLKNADLDTQLTIEKTIMLKERAQGRGEVVKLIDDLIEHGAMQTDKLDRLATTVLRTFSSVLKTHLNNKF